MLSESAVELAPALLMVAGSLHPKIEYVLSLPILRERAAFKVATVCPSPHRYIGKPPVDDQVRPGWTRVDDDNMVTLPRSLASSAVQASVKMDSGPAAGGLAAGGPRTRRPCQRALQSNPCSLRRQQSGCDGCCGAALAAHM